MASLFLTLLGGATFAQAVDVFFHTEAGCNTDTGVGCTDLPNDKCCTFTNPAGDFFNSVQYTNLPTDVHMDVNAIISDGDDCIGDQWFPVLTRPPQTEYYCLEAAYPAKGTRYTVWENADRDVYEVKRSEVEDCVEKREADTLVLKDGTEFSILGLEKKDLAELMAPAKKGIVAADTPTECELFRV